LPVELGLPSQKLTSAASQSSASSVSGTPVSIRRPTSASSVSATASLTFPSLPVADSLWRVRQCTARGVASSSAWPTSCGPDSPLHRPYPRCFFSSLTQADASFCSQLFFIFLVASGILSSSISFNAMSEHGTCTVVFAVCAAIIVAIGASARTFKQISWIGWVGVCAIVTAIMIVVIAVGIADRPPAAPEGPYDKQLKAFNNPKFSDAMVAVVNVCVCLLLLDALEVSARGPRGLTTPLLPAVCLPTLARPASSPSSPR
jgi:magnesium-transporting ATPase (P-type)